MAAPMPRDLASAAAAGNLAVVEKLLASGADVNSCSKDGMTTLGIAAFWGYASISQLLLQHGADINKTNKGTMWTPLHCASFQRMGPVIHKLMAFNPDLQLKDMRGRTAADFASASDSIWPFFAGYHRTPAYGPDIWYNVTETLAKDAAGCARTPRSRLIAMDIVHQALGIPEYTHVKQTRHVADRKKYICSGTGKMSYEATSVTRTEHAYFPQCNSVYGMRSPAEPQDHGLELAALTGDVLANTTEDVIDPNNKSLSLLAWYQ